MEHEKYVKYLEDVLLGEVTTSFFTTGGCGGGTAAKSKNVFVVIIFVQKGRVLRFFFRRWLRSLEKIVHVVVKNGRRAALVLPRAGVTARLGRLCGPPGGGGARGGA